MPDHEGSGSSRRLPVLAGLMRNSPAALIMLAILASILILVEAFNVLAGHLYGAILYMCAIVAALFMYLRITYLMGKYPSGRAHSVGGDIVRYLLILLWVPFFIVVFSQLFRDLYDVFGGFVSPYDDYWHWAQFGLSWFVDDVLLGATEIFDWNLSSIRPTALWSKLFVLAFNIALQVIVITSVVRIYQLLRTRRHRT
jgi:hypothetical protein